MNLNNELYTERLIITAMTNDELQELVALYENIAPELSAAYQEMLTNCLKYPKERLWYTSWKFCLKDIAKAVGYAGFKGLDGNGMAEIGYGVNEGFEGQGYVTEAVKALLEWAIKQPGVKTIEAEAEDDNAASLRVLVKLGFCPTGIRGAEGPRFVLK